MKLSIKTQKANIKAAYDHLLEIVASFDQSDTNPQVIKMIEYQKGRLDAIEAVMHMQAGNPVYIAGMMKYIA